MKAFKLHKSALNYNPWINILNHNLQLVHYCGLLMKKVFAVLMYDEDVL